MGEEARELMRKYSERLENELGGSGFSREYEIFRKEALEKNVSAYEKYCNTAEKILRIKVKEEDRKKLIESIETSHLNISPEAAMSFSALIGISFVLFGILIGIISFVLGDARIFLPSVFILLGAVIARPLSHLPNYIADRWRLKASNQMVLCILYIVMYMRHTSNLEHAIKFAAEHVGDPLGYDLKKVFWDIETGKFLTMKESLDNYLKAWRKYNLEFVEAFHLIEGSLYETNEGRRIEMLEKSLEVMLNGTYENMLHYAHNLQSPIQFLHMLGIILPVLGLVVFPLVGSFLSGLIKWWHLAILYDVILPIFVLFFGFNILSKRPSGYSQNDILKLYPEYKQLIKAEFFGIKASPLFIGILVGTLIVFVGFLPILIHFFNSSYDVEIFGNLFLDYKGENGPYGFWAAILSLFVPLGVALGIGTYYRIKTKELIKKRRELDDLEKEFSGALFQLGNRIGDGIPSEIAFSDVAKNMEGTPTGNFFGLVSMNIRRLGLGLKEAIFGINGAIREYPSSLIESSMKVLLQSSMKGPLIVSKSLITISTYVDRIKQVNERLKDLLAEIISSMKSQISFLTPLIAGIVVGVSTMVVSIINTLGEQLGQSVTGEDAGTFANLINILRIEDVIPGYQFQLVVGIYVVEVIIILTLLANGIERGVDRLSAENSLGKNLIRSTGLYFIVCLVGMFLFNLLANVVGTVSG